MRNVHKVSAVNFHTFMRNRTLDIYEGKQTESSKHVSRNHRGVTNPRIVLNNDLNNQRVHFRRT